MLYIQFKISQEAQFTAFKALYEHLVAVRTPDFSVEVDMEAVDWATLTEEEEELLFDEDLQQQQRYHQLFPSDAQTVIERYFEHDNAKLGPPGIQEVSSIMNYLEYDFEVDLNQLEKLTEGEGLVQFSTGNYPYGGMERFLIVLRAFGMVATECYDGFTIYEFEWTSEFEHLAIELPEKTKAYLENN